MEIEKKINTAEFLSGVKLGVNIGIETTSKAFANELAKVIGHIPDVGFITASDLKKTLTEFETGVRAINVDEELKKTPEYSDVSASSAGPDPL